MFYNSKKITNTLTSLNKCGAKKLVNKVKIFNRQQVRAECFPRKET